MEQSLPFAELSPEQVQKLNEMQQSLSSQFPNGEEVILIAYRKS